MAGPAAAPRSNEPFLTQVSSFGRVFWTVNMMEMVERFAYYGVRTVIPTYMVLSLAEGGPEFTHTEKGIIFMWWAVVQSWLPVFTGGFADRYGYKNSVAFAIVLKIIGYLMMAHMMGFWGFLAGCLFLAAGTAIFKPGVQGTLVTQMGKGRESVGWGIFYMLVNIGGWLGPFLAGYLRLMEWRYVFYACAALVALNFLALLTYEEPSLAADRPRDTRTPWQVFWESCVGLMRPRLIVFVVLFSGFWFMFNQIFDILPNFLDDWVDSAVLWEIGASVTGNAFAAEMAAAHAPFNQEWIINVNPMLIIFLVVPIAWLANFTTPLRSILVGIFIASIGTLALGMTTSVWVAIGSILIFSVGEMASSPKKMEYLATLAKKGEEGLYMGYANIPLGIGWGLGSLFGGFFYDRFGDRTNLARQHMTEQLGVSGTLVDTLPKDDVFGVLRTATGMSHPDAVAMLWDLYNPGVMWTIFAGIGVASLIGLAIYDYALRRIDAGGGSTATALPKAAK